MADDNLILREIIAQQIAQSPQHCITFAEYMHEVLYHHQHGYYVTQATRMGDRGDFVTASHLATDFGELLAEQLIQMWEVLRRPTPFVILEMGAGQGILARDLLTYLAQSNPECFAIVQYWIIEQSATLTNLQQQQLQGWPVQWWTWDQIPKAEIVGCCFSNELVDAFPVHQILIQSGKLYEIYVTTRPDSDGQLQFQELVAEPSTPELAAYFDQLNLDLSQYPDGYRSEVNLDALDWIKTVADRLKCGYLLTIDYGHLAHRYYSLARRAGTLQCYYQHAHHSHPYVHIGYQDLTAHVDFTTLQRQGEVRGLQTLGFIEQGLFLMALGLGDRIAAISHPESSSSNLDLQHRLARRQALHTLIDPFGLGNFGVLIQAKGLDTNQLSQVLKGLQH
jgi:SAM-dependent MidA family methyltransferase